MRITYVLPSSSISGGIKVALEHVRVFNEFTPYEAVAVSKYEYPNWVGFNVPFERIRSFADVVLKCSDIIVVTFVNHIQELYSRYPEKLVHFCQGYEGDFLDYVPGNLLGGISRSEWKRVINHAYSLPIPRITIGSWINKRLSKINKQMSVFCVGQPINLDIFNPQNRRKYQGNKTVRILNVGDFRYSFKGIGKVLKIFKLLKDSFGDQITITRVSPANTYDEEKKQCSIDEYYCELTQPEVADIYRKSDILLYLPFSEGFGLPVLEAMACGTPVVCSSIPSLIFLTSNGLYGEITSNSMESIIEKIKRLITDPARRSYLGKEAVRRAESFSYERLGKKLLDFAIWFERIKRS